MTKVFDLEIVTPQKTVYKGMVKSVTAMGTQGSFGILVDHAPFITELQTSILTIQDEKNATMHFALDKGFFEVVTNKVIVLTDMCVTKEEVNVAKMQEDKKSAEQALGKECTPEEKERAMAVLKRADTWLSLANK
ncbi:MAG: ATP synthase F1 subunit epsilon [Planctomycetes bacterium]|nr:ATP synthase F1 subunit epsilon [Planctomycetota bacterium]